MTDRIAGAAGRALTALTSGLFVLACAALAGIVATTVFEVVVRYAFDAPTSWAADAAGFLLAPAIALALPEVTRQRGHVAIDVLSQRSLWLGLHGRLIAGLAAAACLAAAVLIGDEALRQMSRGVTTQGATAIPKAWLTAIAALGLAVAAFQFAAQALRQLPDRD